MFDFVPNSSSGSAITQPLIDGLKISALNILKSLPIWFIPIWFWVTLAILLIAFFLFFVYINFIR